MQSMKNCFTKQVKNTLQNISFVTPYNRFPIFLTKSNELKRFYLKRPTCRIVKQYKRSVATDLQKIVSQLNNEVNKVI